jgi:hypothetical protein
MLRVVCRRSKHTSSAQLAQFCVSETWLEVNNEFCDRHIEMNVGREHSMD